VPNEGPPHPFVIAEPCPPRDLDHAANIAAFQQQPRGLHPQRLDPARRRHSGAAGLGAREGSRAHAGFFGERFDLEIAGDILDDPGVQRAEALSTSEACAASTVENWRWPPGRQASS
jgi:hypothetical protein